MELTDEEKDQLNTDTLVELGLIKPYVTPKPVVREEKHE